MDYVFLIKQIKKLYVFADMVSFGYDYWVQFNYVRSNAYKNFTITVDLPPFVLSYGNYSVKYLIVSIAKTALANDYPKYRFRALMAGSSSLSYHTFVSLPDPNNVDTNLMTGIT